MRRRFREADRALQVAVVRDLQRRETAVFAHGRTESAVVGQP